MKIVIPFVPNKLRPEVRQLGEDVGAEFVDVSRSDTAYGELIAGRWKQGESFILCEHDVLAQRRLLEEIARCPEPWCCGYAWRFSGAVLPGEDRPQKPIRERETALFCHRFAASLLHQTPHVVRVASVPWQALDLAVLGLLSSHGATPHLHEPPVRHLRQQHPSWASAMTESDCAPLGA